MKKIIHEKSARDKLLQGTELMYKTVATTLGPAGRNVAIGRPWGTPLVIHDGVTVSREVMHEDEFVEIGIKLIKEAANKTNTEAGDGTTSSILLAYHIVSEGMKIIDSGTNAMVLRKEIEAVIPSLKKRLDEISQRIKSSADLERVATVSSADPELGKIVAEAVDRIGKEGAVTVEESYTSETYVKYTDGYQIDKGYAAPHFITNPDRMESVIDTPLIAILGKKVTGNREIIPLLEVMFSKSKNLFIVGEVGGDAMTTCVTNKMKGTVSLLVVQPPGLKQEFDEYLADIAAITGATIIKDELGLDIQQFAAQFNQSWFGSAESVMANRNSTVIVKGGGNPDERSKQLQERLKVADSVFEQEKLKERIAKLTTGVAVIKVGGKIEIEQREKVERVKDAVGASRAALEEGVVPGGGIAFMRMAEAIKDDQTMGGKLMYHVLQQPIKKLLLNAGKSDEEIEKILETIKTKPENFGHELNSDSIVDMVDKGIIDPSKVIRLALENAVSVSGSILTTDAIVADKIEPKTNEQIV